MLSKGAVFKKQRPTIRRTNTREVNEAGQQFHPGQQEGLQTTASSIPDVNITLTPAQRMAKKKAEAIAKREEEMRLAAQGAKQNYDKAK